MRDRTRFRNCNLPLRMVQASATAAPSNHVLHQYAQAWDRAARARRARRAASRPSPACRAVRTRAVGQVQCHGRRCCKGPDWSRNDRPVEFFDAARKITANSEASSFRRLWSVLNGLSCLDGCTGSVLFSVEGEPTKTQIALAREVATYPPVRFLQMTGRMDRKACRKPI